jgi:hypothetical protein
VVECGDAEDVSCFSDAGGEVKVVLAGGGVAAGMIVEDDGAGGVGEECWEEESSWFGECLVQGAGVGEGVADGLVSVVEEE